MNNETPEIITKSILSDLELKTKAKAILAEPDRSRAFVEFLGIIAAIAIGRFAFENFKAPDLAVSLLVGMLAGIVALAIELWRVRRRLESIILLVKLANLDEEV